LKNSSANLLPKGSIVISSRAPIGYVAIGGDDFTTNQGCKSIVPNEKFDSEFLYYNLNFYVERIKRLGEGTTFAEISKGDLEKIKLPHPDSFQVQQKIAKILSSVDSVIEKTEAAIAKYQAIKQGMLHDLFTRGIDTKTGKLRPKYKDAPEMYKKSALGWIPKEWDIKIFGKEVELVHGYQFRNYDFTEFGIPVIKIGQVKPENIDLTNCSFAGLDREKDFQNEIIRNGDVLMALTGATLGKTCLVKNLNAIAFQNYRVGRFEPVIKENDIDKIFLYYSMVEGYLLKQIFSKVNFGAQGNIGKSDFEKAIFLKPPFKEQHRISNKILKVDEKLKIEHDYFKKLNKMKKGLMADLLSGRKEVNTEPNQ
jgi:type I restriction enzyme, S subunit